jgi:hypothetical protein
MPVNHLTVRCRCGEILLHKRCFFIPKEGEAEAEFLCRSCLALMPTLRPHAVQVYILGTVVGRM